MQINPAKMGQALRAVRIRLGITQRELAEKVGVSINYLSLVESGKRGISLTQLHRLASGLGVPATFVLVYATESTTGTSVLSRRTLKKMQLLVTQALELPTQ